MVTPGFFLRLYAYNDWANGAVLDAAERLSPADYTRDFGQSWGSVRGILTHVMAADRVWLTRWQGSRLPDWITTKRPRPPSPPCAWPGRP